METTETAAATAEQASTPVESTTPTTSANLIWQPEPISTGCTSDHLLRFLNRSLLNAVESAKRIRLFAALPSNSS